MSKKALATLLEAYHWEKLLRLADHYGEEDIKEFGLKIFKHAIREQEIWMHADLFKKHEQLIIDLEESERQNWERLLAENGEGDGYYDDDIPF